MRSGWILFLIVAFSSFVLIVAPNIGYQSISAEEILHPDFSNTGSILFWKVRVPRVAAAYLAGAVLAICGAAFQALFRNPLATPFTLGISTAASLGSVLYIRLGLSFNLPGLPGVCISAFAGAIFCIIIVYGLSRMGDGFSTSRLLLAGVAVSFFFSSLIMVTHYTSDASDVFRLMRRLMGSLSGSDSETVAGILPIAMGGFLLLMLIAWELNLIAMGEEFAMTKGVDLNRHRHILFFSTSLMEGAVVAFCGPIGFVGLMVPHMCRILIGSRHQWLIPASFFFGGGFLTACDTFARMAVAPAEMPVGIITSLLGGPFFLWLLFRGRNI